MTELPRGRHWKHLIVPEAELRKALLYLQMESNSSGKEAVGFFVRAVQDGVLFHPAINISDHPETSFEVDGEHIYRLDELNLPPIGIIHSHFRNPRASKTDILAFPVWSEMVFGLVWCLKDRTLCYYDATDQTPVSLEGFELNPPVQGREDEW